MAALLSALVARGLGLTRFGLAGDKQPPAQPVNINTASVAELQKLPGIGPATARAIVSYRQRHGPFRRVEELLIVRGISRSRLNALRRYITVQSQKPK
jgi:competence protein ComEA